MSDGCGRLAAIVDQTRLRDIFAGGRLILASQNVIIAENIKRCPTGEQRSERTTAAECTCNVLNIAAGNPVIGVAALIWIGRLS